MDWSLREGYSWAEDKEHCEEYGRMLNADPSKVRGRHPTGIARGVLMPSCSGHTRTQGS